MPHVMSEAAEQLLDREFKVLDHGFVRLVDYMGGDARIVAAARVSYGAGTKTVTEDAGLIDYLMRHKHTSPFEQVELTFHCKMPVFTARQWIRHRTASVNEVSGRYSELPAEFYIPDVEVIRKQSTTNKQGRDTPLDETQASHFRDNVALEGHNAFISYQTALKQDVARELARITLPLGTYTEWYWKIDLHNLFHFLALRLDTHAQWEIQQYAKVMLEMARAVAPLATAAFEKHVLDAITLTREDCDELRHYIFSHPCRYDNPRKRAEYDAKMAKGGFDEWRI